MFSFSKCAVACIGLAVAICFTIVPSPATAQHAEHAAQDSAKKMPMKMPMGAATKKKQSKKPAAKSATKKRTTASKAATKVADTSHQNMPGMEPGAGHADSMRAMPPGMPMPGMPPAGQLPRMPAGMQMPRMRTRSAEDMMIGPLGISMERMGSGTTWIPDAVTLPSRRRMLGDWMLMAHGFVFGQYDHQRAERGNEQWGSLNWAMLMATRDFAGGRFQARTMLSLDPLTVTKRGYP